MSTTAFARLELVVPTRYRQSSVQKMDVRSGFQPLPGRNLHPHVSGDLVMTK